jgi:hypothetical protein
LQKQINTRKKFFSDFDAALPFISTGNVSFCEVITGCVILHA